MSENLIALASSPEKKDLSLYDYLPPNLAKAYDLIPPDWFLLPEDQLRKACYPDIENNRNTSQSYRNDQKIRISLWNEFERCVTFNSPTLIIRNIYHGIINEGTWRNLVLNPNRVAWIVNPPGDYKTTIGDLHNRYLERIYEIAELPIYQTICRCNWYCVCKRPNIAAGRMKPEDCACHPTCKCPPIPNTKVADSLIKAYQLIELRAKGSIPQVIRQDNRNVNVNINSQTKQLPAGESLDEINAQLARVEAKLNVLSPGKSMPELIEAQVVEEEPQA